jgi:hypothetical protein
MHFPFDGADSPHASEEFGCRWGRFASCETGTRLYRMGQFRFHSVIRKTGGRDGRLSTSFCVARWLKRAHLGVLRKGHWCVQLQLNGGACGDFYVFAFAQQ